MFYTPNPSGAFPSLHPLPYVRTSVQHDARKEGRLSFASFAESQLAVEMQLIVRPGPKPPALLAFIQVIEKMKERIERKA